jgi:transcriptional regulator with XRE-family HTH domain
MILPEVINVNYKLMGAKLRRARKRMRLTIEQAAEQVEMSASFLGLIERGTRIPSVETIVRLCKLYHVSADVILDV